MPLPQLEASVYSNAEKLLMPLRPKLVVGGTVTPRWIDKGARFWYRVDAPQGPSFVLVDPAERKREPAFDHERLAKSLGAASGTSVDGEALPFGAIDLSDEQVGFYAFDAQWRCSLDSYVCEKDDDHVPPNPLEATSPDGKWAVFRRGYDLWIRTVATGEERALTSDGVADCSYGFPPDCLSFGVLIRQLGLPYFPPLVAWSPDSQRLITHRTDQRDMRLSHLVESTPADGGRPVVHTYRYPMPGDEVMPRAELLVFDAETATAVSAKDEPLLMPELSPVMGGRVWWSPDGTAAYYLQQPRDQRALVLKHLDPVTGDVRTLIEERGEPRVAPGQFADAKPIVQVLSDGREVLWYSQRDGWGHLYLYDTESGALPTQVTSGEWAVREILHVDADERVVYFVASGLIAADPYRRQVCRVGLDGSGFARLGDDDLDHIVVVPENAAYYVDSASTNDTPPVITVRGWDGMVLVELERADVSGLVTTGWTPPERFCVKAADGETDIYGVIYRPRDFDPTQRYPVIDAPYPGPQIHRVQPAFGEQVPLYDTEALAALGFVVIAVDGRGTPGRSKAFHDLQYGRLDKAGFLEDHVAAFDQLGQTRPWMDLDRVGIFGFSGGGRATVRALCDYPEVFKVGVSMCGDHDERYYQLCWGETWLGPYDEDTYARASNVEVVDRLQGKLLLVHGEMDDNVHPQLTLRLVDRLIAANKDFDLLIVPGAEHLFIGYGHYVRRRMWDFFVRHLLGMEPPAGYQPADVRPDLEDIFS